MTERLSSKTVWLLECWVRYLCFSKLDVGYCCKACKIMVHIFKNKVQANRNPWSNHAFKPHDIWMIKPSQHNDFPWHKTDTFWIHISKANLLECYNFFGFEITSSINTAVSSLANLQHDRKKLWLVLELVKKRRSKNDGGLALSNFSKESALRGIQPLMASPATAVTLNILHTLGGCGACPLDVDVHQRRWRLLPLHFHLHWIWGEP